MECEKFEAVVMDELYGELDEVRSAAAKRHLGGCWQCAALFYGLRATRRVAAPSWVEPPPGFDARLTAMAYAPPARVPLGQRLARGLSLAGNWAMRPQSAMAAVLLVMLGASGLLLRARPSRSAASSAVIVTEEGAPTPRGAAPSLSRGDDSARSDSDEISRVARSSGPFARPPPARAVPQAEAPPAPTASDGVAGGGAHLYAASPGAGDEGLAAKAAAPAASPIARGSAAAAPALRTDSPDSFAGALSAYRQGKYDAAIQSFDGLSPTSVDAALWAARAVRDGHGCRLALSRFDVVSERAPGMKAGWDGALEGARCARAVGDVQSARSRLTPLLGVDAYRERARFELDRLDHPPPASKP